MIGPACRDAVLVDQRVTGDAGGDREPERDAAQVRVPDAADEHDPRDDQGDGRHLDTTCRARGRRPTRAARAPARRRGPAGTPPTAAPAGRRPRAARSTRARTRRCRRATARRRACALQTTTATGAKTTSAVTSATTVADSVSGARASSRFHSAWNQAAARAKARAVAGMCGRYARTHAGCQRGRLRLQRHPFRRRADPAQVYPELFATGLTEHEYYARLAGLSEEEILGR